MEQIEREVQCYDATYQFKLGENETHCTLNSVRLYLILFVTTFDDPRKLFCFSYVSVVTTKGGGYNQSRIRYIYLLYGSGYNAEDDGNGPDKNGHSTRIVKYENSQIQKWSKMKMAKKKMVNKRE